MKASKKDIRGSDLFNRGEPASPDAPPEITAAANGSELVDMFERFLSLEKEAKSVNERKAELFAMTKNSGFDPKAVRVAFRQLFRELEKPEAAQKHDDLNSLTASYLKALRGDCAVAGQSDSSHPITSCDPSKACSEPLARSRKREGASEVPGGSMSNIIGSSDPGPVPTVGGLRPWGS